NPAMADILDTTPAVIEWMDRMATIGYGEMGKLSATEAIEIAAAMEPAPRPEDSFQNDHGIALGSRVTVAAETFAQEPTEGILLAATRTRYTLERTDERAGKLHVHFPRIGFVLREVRA